jgi:hypothetical protein
VVETPHDHAAVLVAVEHVEPPEGPVEAEGHAHQVAHDLAQGLVATGGRQVHLQDMSVEVEAGIDLPVRPAFVVEDPLAEPPYGLQAASEQVAQTLPLQRLVQHQAAVDDHQVGRIVHPQPGMIYGG